MHIESVFDFLLAVPNSGLRMNRQQHHRHVSMNSNTVRVQLEFSFKGETHALDEVIDLDQITVEDGSLPDIHRLLARKAGVDPISYLYEVMESYDRHFSDAVGQAAGYCHNGQFDWRNFEYARRDEGDWARIRAVVQGRIAAHELDSNLDLRSTLLAVYRAGKASA